MIAYEHPAITAAAVGSASHPPRRADIEAAVLDESRPIPPTTPSVARAARPGTTSSSHRAAAAIANSGAVPTMEPVIVGPNRLVASNLSKVTDTGNSSPTTPNSNAAWKTNPDRSSTNGEAAINESVALGMLIAAPARASIHRRPNLLVTIAVPKQTAEEPARAWAMVLASITRSGPSGVIGLDEHSLTATIVKTNNDHSIHQEY